MNNFKNKSGSALLIAMLIMAVLLVAGLGINKLIVAELRVERTLVEGGQAYYLAEGASELGLYDVVTNESGYEASKEADGYAYSIVAKGDVWPCDDYGDLVEEDDAGDLWRILEREKSVTIPLGKLSDFKLYFDYETITGVSPLGEALRWKILGIDENGFTEAISGYDELSGAGYWQALAHNAGSYQQAGFSWGGRLWEWLAGENVSNFLKDHKYNYLIITNVIQDGNEGDRLLIRIDSGDDEFVCEYMKVEADGMVGEYIQQIDAYMKEGEPLPVFDFVLWEVSN